MSGMAFRQPGADPYHVVRVPSIETSRPILAALVCLIIIALGAIVRLMGTDWDEGANLHPDERHMMFVVSDTMAALDAPEPGESSLSDIWFNAGESPLDPRRGGRLYVYGELPHLAVTVAARSAQISGWPETLHFARTIGAVLDAYTILAVFLLGYLTLNSAIAAVGGAVLYAFAPLAIQHANFFTVDVWLTAAATWCVVASTMIIRARSYAGVVGWTAISGVLAGAALACKLPGLALVGVVLVAALIAHWRVSKLGRPARFAATVAVALISAFTSFRLASPFTFEGPGVLGLAPAAATLDDYAEMSRLVLDIGFPPSWQWIADNSAHNAVRDLAIWGLGPFTSMALLVGVARLARNLRNRPDLLPSAVLVAAFLVYWLGTSIPALRYVLPVVPVLCVLAAAPFCRFEQSRAGQAAMALCGLAAIGWGLGMVMIHSETNSRVAASRWLWANTAVGTRVLNETGWDEGLPVAVRLATGSELVWPDSGKHFRFSKLDMEYPDSAEKARAIAQKLGETDLLVISSERMRKPIRALADHFPMSSAYYEMLEDGRLCFELVYSKASRYPVLIFDLDDTSAQEPWSVYDHPTVEIYRKLPCYDRAETQRLLDQALANGS